MRKYAAATGALSGVVAVAAALVMSTQDPILGPPWGHTWGFVAETDLLLTALSAVGLLFGMGLVMIAGGLVTLKWPAIGGIITVSAAVVGLVYTYTHQWYRMELLTWWAAPVLLCWLAGILAGYALHRETEAYG
ncbi:MAG: hypothetical protein V2J16_01180 [Thermoleophilia bacterium]|jgi:hypothetical protein|nr:hypothetical protein [Thermoleophilia bacterium]